MLDRFASSSVIVGINSESISLEDTREPGRFRNRKLPGCNGTDEQAATTHTFQVR